MAVRTELDVLEVPQNGWAGLRHWRYDLMAGSLGWVPALVYCLGISQMSGFPLVSGVWTAIIAGLIFPLVGGSYLTISGPGVGLAPLMLWTVLSMGLGDMVLGYERALVVIFSVGVLMVILSFLKVASLGKKFPPAVIHGMLAAIGLIAIAKQLPHVLGTAFAGHHFRDILLETPRAARAAFWPVFLVAAATLGSLVFLSLLRCRLLAARSHRGWAAVPLLWWLRTVPPQVTGVIIGLAAGAAVGLPDQFLTQIPADILAGFTFPDFAGVAGDSSLWGIFSLAVLLLLLIDGVESVTTVLGIDSIDPWRRQSNPDRVWRAMGLTNCVGSLFGCMPVIPGGMKSTFNKELGARTLWANFYIAAFLLAALLAGRWLINLIPMAVLAAVLLHVGSKLTLHMCRKTWAAGGRQEWALFLLTAVTTLATDDLVAGIGAGSAAAFGCWGARRLLLPAAAEAPPAEYLPDLVLAPAEEGA